MSIGTGFVYGSEKDSSDVLRNGIEHNPKQLSESPNKTTKCKNVYRHWSEEEKNRLKNLLSDKDGKNIYFTGTGDNRCINWEKFEKYNNFNRSKSALQHMTIKWGLAGTDYKWQPEQLLCIEQYIKDNLQNGHNRIDHTALLTQMKLSQSLSDGLRFQITKIRAKLKKTGMLPAPKPVVQKCDCSREGEVWSQDDIKTLESEIAKHSQPGDDKIHWQEMKEDLEKKLGRSLSAIQTFVSRNLAKEQDQRRDYGKLHQSLKNAMEDDNNVVKNGRYDILKIQNILKRKNLDLSKGQIAYRIKNIKTEEGRQSKETEKLWSNSIKKAKETRKKRKSIREITERMAARRK